jgi:hypothetical protein
MNYNQEKTILKEISEREGQRDRGTEEERKEGRKEGRNFKEGRKNKGEKMRERERVY